MAQFVWVDLYNDVLGLSVALKGITTLPQHGLERLSTSPPPQADTQTHTEKHTRLSLFLFVSA